MHTGRAGWKDLFHLTDTINDRGYHNDDDFSGEGGEGFACQLGLLSTADTPFSHTKILDLKGISDKGPFLGVKNLKKTIPDNLTLIIECFAKITDVMNRDTQMYLSPKEAKPIIEAGLHIEDPQVHKNAECAKEKLQ